MAMIHSPVMILNTAMAAVIIIASAVVNQNKMGSSFILAPPHLQNEPDQDKLYAVGRCIRPLQQAP